MKRQRHSHPCVECGRPTPCGGTWEYNHDGFPEAICSWYHAPEGIINPAFVCEACGELSEAAKVLRENLWELYK